MMDINVDGVIKIDSEYAKLVSDVAECYSGQWDDRVHDSYSNYVKQVQDYSQNMHEIRSKSESIIEEIQSFNIDGLIQEADSLCMEADAL